MYHSESASWEPRRDELEHRELVERTADQLVRSSRRPVRWQTSAAGPGLMLAPSQAAYAVTGLDGSSRMVAVARDRVARSKLNVTFEVADVTLAPLVRSLTDDSTRQPRSQLARCRAGSKASGAPTRGRRRASTPPRATPSGRGPTQ